MYMYMYTSLGKVENFCRKRKCTRIYMYMYIHMHMYMEGSKTGRNLVCQHRNQIFLENRYVYVSAHA